MMDETLDKDQPDQKNDETDVRGSDSTTYVHPVLPALSRLENSKDGTAPVTIHVSVQPILSKPGLSTWSRCMPRGSQPTYPSTQSFPTRLKRWPYSKTH
jgi:hypothetical protein